MSLKSLIHRLSVLQGTPAKNAQGTLQAPLYKAVPPIPPVPPAKTKSELDAALSRACTGLNIDTEEVYAALALADLDDWMNGDLSTETLTAFARSLVQQREMAEGKVPSSYTKKALCRRCGPVWLWIEGTVAACPWCFHRAAGKTVPRP